MRQLYAGDDDYFTNWGRQEETGFCRRSDFIKGDTMRRQLRECGSAEADVTRVPEIYKKKKEEEKGEKKRAQRAAVKYETQIESKSRCAATANGRSGLLFPASWKTARNLTENRDRRNPPVVPWRITISSARLRETRHSSRREYYYDADEEDDDDDRA